MPYGQVLNTFIEVIRSLPIATSWRLRFAYIQQGKGDDAAGETDQMLLEVGGRHGCGNMARLPVMFVSSSFRAEFSDQRRFLRSDTGARL